ncbi:MAG: TIGR03620 family F420-dependent LLM class oxidoreductase [SAR324 cluster bacterium]
MEIGRLGVWANLDTMTAGAAADFARRVEGWGYGALWIPESRGRNVLVHAAFLLSATKRLAVASGIANIYARDAVAMAAGQKALAEASGDRFLLGMGVSHSPMVETLRGHSYGKPVATMKAYLEAMARAPYTGPAPRQTPPTVLAALGPLMLKLAGERTAGAHPYLTTPEHTRRARAILGTGKWLCPEQMAMLETDPRRARSTARKAIGYYFQLVNYRNSLLSLGFTEADFADGGCDRLIDAVVAWGDVPAIRRRIQAHWDAGADHVCIQALKPDGAPGPDERALQLLAPGVP